MHPHDPETDVNLLNAAINKVDSEIVNLYKRRSQLLAKVNDLKASTRHLPPEILTEIFRLYARSTQGQYFVDLSLLLKIGAVCSQWRETAWSAPHLWTTSLLTLPRRRDRGRGTIPLFVTLLALHNCQ